MHAKILIFLLLYKSPKYIYAIEQNKKRQPYRLPLFTYPVFLLADVDLVDLGLLAGGTGEEVLGSDDGGAFITLDLLYPELHG